MWTTFDQTNDSTVQYGDHGDDLANTANGNMVKFVDGGSKHTVRYMHVHCKINCSKTSLQIW